MFLHLFLQIRQLLLEGVAFRFGFGHSLLLLLLGFQPVLLSLREQGLVISVLLLLDFDVELEILRRLLFGRDLGCELGFTFLRGFELSR